MTFVIVLCLVPAILSVVIDTVFYKNPLKISRFIFYCSTNLCFLSLAKVLKGELANTLVESFEDGVLRSYIHYGIPLFVICILMPFIIKKVSKYFVISNTFISSLVLVFSLYLIARGKIDNIGFLLCWIIAVGVIFYECLKDKENHWFSLVDLKGRLKYITAPVIFICFMNWVFLPTEIYFGNISDFTVKYNNFAISMWIAFVLTAILLCALFTLCLTDRHFSFAYIGIGVIGICEYIQVMFLNGKMSIMDGSESGWSASVSYTNLIMWVLIFLAVFSFVLYAKKINAGIICYITAFLFAIHLSTYVVLRLTNPVDTSQEGVITTDNILDVSAKNNVIVFVLDWFDTQIVDEIVKDNPAFLEPLQDFTYYDNCTSQYAFTYMAIPYLLSGTDCFDGMTEKEYTRYAFENSTFLDRIHDSGYDIGIYTDGTCLSPKAQGLSDNWLPIVNAQRVKYVDLAKVIYKIGRYKSSPYCVKDEYAYSRKELLKTIEIDDSINQVGYDITDDNEFYQQVHNSGLCINEAYSEGTFRFYHMFGAHPGGGMDDTCSAAESPSVKQSAIGAMKTVFEYIEQLKALEAYDDAMIIITADHGQNYTLDPGIQERLFETVTSNPILFVKTPGETHEVIDVNSTPLCHEDLHETVIKYVNPLTVDENKNTIFDINDSDNRIRKTVVYRSTDIPWTEYSINGYVRDVKSWSPTPIG